MDGQGIGIQAGSSLSAVTRMRIEPISTPNPKASTLPPPSQRTAAQPPPDAARGYGVGRSIDLVG